MTIINQGRMQRSDLLYTPTQDRTGNWNQQNRSRNQSTLSKTYTNHKSTEPGSHSPLFTSDNVSRLEEARRTIDTVIIDLIDKRDMNGEGTSQIRSVNSEVLGELRRGPAYSCYEKDSASTYISDPRCYRSSMHDLRVSQPQEDQLLRRQLGDEMAWNEELMMRISRLEDENKGLRRENQMSFGPTKDTRTLQAQNERLRRSLAEVSYLPEQIFSELQELKLENQSLRKDTLKLLKNADRMF